MMLKKGPPTHMKTGTEMPGEPDAAQRRAYGRLRTRMLLALVLTTIGSLPACDAILSVVTPTTDPAETHDIPAFSILDPDPSISYERFMVIGDWGTGRPDQMRVADAMADRATTDGFSFILTTGDNFYPDGVISVDDSQWQTTFEEMYGSPSLAVPFYASLGNHDHKGSVDAQVAYTHISDRWRMPGRYYTFHRILDDGTDIQFFALDTVPIHEGIASTSIQRAWLDRELAASTSRWKIVYGHHPLYGHNPGRGHNRRMIDVLEPVFIEHDVDVYFAGHDHALEMIKPIRGVRYVISGAGAGPDKAYPVLWTDESYYVATLGGFVQCRISRDTLVIEFVRLDGETQYAHVLVKE